TRPWTVRSGFAFSVATSFMTSSLVGGSALLLADQHGVDASDLATHAPDLVGLRELPGRLLHAQRELLLVQVDEVGGELCRGFLTQFLEFHQRTVRVTKVVVTESLAAARRNASRAVA